MLAWEDSPVVLPDILVGDSRSSSEALVASNIAYLLGDTIRSMVTETGTYEAALFGKARISKPPATQGVIDQQRILEQLGVFEWCYFDHTAGEGFNFRTTRGYNQRAQTPGAEGYKFYFSADLSGPRGLEAGTALYREFASRAVEADVVFASKHWVEHLYDALLVYTVGLPDTAKVAEILRSIYSRYRDEVVFQSTPHIFQGAIEGIDPDHIGWVREDLPGMSHYRKGPTSHSRRLQRLGAGVDMLGLPEAGNTESHITAVAANLTPATFAASALAAWVRPDRPYLTHNLKQEM